MAQLRQHARRIADQRVYELTELGNAERLAQRHGDRLRYVSEWGAWLENDGKRWQRDKVGTETIAAKSVVRDLYAEAAGVASAGTADDDGAGKRAGVVMRWARASSKASAIRAMVSLAQSEPPIAATADAFDRDPFAFNVDNGTVDLRTGDLRPHRAADMITRLAPVTFDPDALCPQWEAFLAQVLPDAEVRGFVQRFAGYALTGDVGEQVLAFFYGSGANGKSTLIEMLLAIVGDHGQTGAPDLLLAKHGEAHPTELADLQGARLVACQEIEEGRAWSEKTVKWLTGGDTIKARRMRCNFYEFLPTHKLLVAANHKPKVRGTDEAIWRRIRLVPFGVTIPKAERDRLLLTKLRAEASGILAWAVRGCLAWQRDGLGEPAAVINATAGYRADQDVLGLFLADECVLVPDAFAAMGTIYDTYKSWCPRAGIDHPWSREAVRERLLERDGLADDRTKAARGIRGLGLKTVRGDAVTVDSRFPG